MTQVNPLSWILASMIMVETNTYVLWSKDNISPTTVMKTSYMCFQVYNYLEASYKVVTLFLQIENLLSMG
jgi:hypothetical protein